MVIRENKEFQVFVLRGVGAASLKSCTPFTLCTKIISASSDFLAYRSHDPFPKRFLYSAGIGKEAIYFLCFLPFLSCRQWIILWYHFPP